jgi:membrane-associated phospholipid phosphatase
VKLAQGSILHREVSPRAWAIGLVRLWIHDVGWVGRALGPILALLLLGVSRDNWSVATLALLAVLAGLLLAGSIVGVRERRVWLLYVVLFVLFVQLRRLADDVGMPLQVDYAVDLERVMSLGGLPSRELQAAFYTPGRIAPWDIYFTLVYVSYFFAPHVLLFAFWQLKREAFPRLLVSLLVILYVGVVVGAVLPTAPPWLAAESGKIHGVARVLPQLSASVSSEAYGQGEHVAGGNEVAAMPSLHMAVTVLVALALRSWNRILAVLAVCYAISMALALVYLGEHYLVDVLAGAALALTVWMLAPSILQAATLGSFRWRLERWRGKPIAERLESGTTS